MVLFPFRRLSDVVFILSIGIKSPEDCYKLKKKDFTSLEGASFLEKSHLPFPRLFLSHFAHFVIQGTSMSSKSLKLCFQITKSGNYGGSTPFRANSGALSTISAPTSTGSAASSASPHLRTGKTSPLSFFSNYFIIFILRLSSSLFLRSLFAL